MRALPAVAAYAAGVQVATLRQWVRRGHITAPNGDGCYDLAEIMQYSERRDATQFGRARASRCRRGEERGSLKSA